MVFPSPSPPKVSRSGEDESQEDVLMDEAPSNLSQASTLQANREGECSGGASKNFGGLMGGPWGGYWGPTYPPLPHPHPPAKIP